MKIKLLKQFMFVSKQVFYIFLLQLIMLQLVNANETKSQSIEHVKISVKMEEAGLKEIFTAIEEKTEFVFIYDASILSDENTVNINSKNAPVVDILQRIASGFNLNFRQINHSIFVKEAELENSVKENSSIQQPSKEIKGKVTDDTGFPLPGVSVSVKGTTTGTVTVADGSYQLLIPESAEIIVYSFIGMEPQEIEIGNKSQIDVILTETATWLNEIVAVGYGIKQKKDLTGAVSVVEVNEISSTPVAGIDQMMQGRLAGVNIVGDYAPGGGVSVRVRGFSTIRNNDPLYIIDGVPIESGINMVNPNDIESIQIGRASCRERV